MHQFCRIGAHAFIGMGMPRQRRRAAVRDCGADYGRPRGINSEGLKRRGFDAERIAAIKRAYRTMYPATVRSPKRAPNSRATAADAPDVAAMLDFIEASERPLALCFGRRRRLRVRPLFASHSSPAKRPAICSAPD